jgi:hypothetical protein
MEFSFPDANRNSPLEDSFGDDSSATSAVTTSHDTLGKVNVLFERLLFGRPLLQFATSICDGHRS